MAVNPTTPLPPFIETTSGKFIATAHIIALDHTEISWRATTRNNQTFHLSDHAVRTLTHNALRDKPKPPQDITP